MQEITAFINQVGFPIFVSVFLLLRLEPSIKKNAEVNAAILEYMRGNKTAAVKPDAG